jgi:hypothetical protein
VDAAEDNPFNSALRRGAAGEFKAVADEVRELDNLVLLIVVAKDYKPLSELLLQRPDALSQFGIG